MPHKWNYVHDMVGCNYRLTNLAAVLGVALLELLPGFFEYTHSQGIMTRPAWELMNRLKMLNTARP